MKRFLLVSGIAVAALLVYFSSEIREYTGSILTPEEVRQVTFTEHPITLQDGKIIHLTAPDTYDIIPAAEGLKRIRFMNWSPDGKLFLTDMYDLSDNTRGRIYILDQFDESTGTFASTTVYLDKLRNPNSLAFY